MIKFTTKIMPVALFDKILALANKDGLTFVELLEQMLEQYENKKA